MNANNAVWNMLKELNNKKGINEIVINRPSGVFVERSGQFIQLNVQLPRADVDEFLADVARQNGKRFDGEQAIMDARLPDGSRLNAIREPYVEGHPAISIRKYSKTIKSFDDDPTIFGLNEKWVEFFKAMVSARFNIIVSGGTGTGKTTFLNLLLAELSNQERVVTIEDTLELQINVPNLVRLEAVRNFGDGKMYYSTRDLVKNTLRMRPDRIIIGEVRGDELFDLLQVMNTGHEGSMTSVHANTPYEAVSRMETLYMLAGYEVPYHVIRRQIASAVHFIVQISRDQEGARVVQSVIQLTGVENDRITHQTILEREDGFLRHTGITPKFMERFNERGGIPLDFFR